MNEILIIHKNNEVFKDLIKSTFSKFFRINEIKNINWDEINKSLEKKFKYIFYITYFKSDLSKDLSKQEILDIVKINLLIPFFLIDYCFHSKTKILFFIHSFNEINYDILLPLIIKEALKSVIKFPELSFVKIIETDLLTKNENVLMLIKNIIQKIIDNNFKTYIKIGV